MWWIPLLSSYLLMRKLRQGKAEPLIYIYIHMNTDFINKVKCKKQVGRITHESKN